jgi:outer membrane cobalamin receptor
MISTVLIGALLSLLQPSGDLKVSGYPFGAGAQAVQPAGVSGTIVDSSGSTVPGATVQLEAAGVVVSKMQTGSDGRFSFDPVTRTPIRVVVTAPGFAPHATPLSPAPSGPLTITLEPAPFFDVVQVTSSRGLDARADPAVAATVLPVAEIMTSAAVAIDDVLKVVPGFTLFPSSRVANPTTQTIMLRGLGSGVSRSLVLADGVPLNDAFGGWVYWDKVPHAAIDRIEVVRGGGGDLYGADAVGGVVQILTVEPGGPFVRLLLEAGNLQTGRLSGFVGTRRGPWTMSAGAQWFTTDGFIRVADEERGAIDRASGSAHRSLIASVSYVSANGWRGGLRGNLFSEDRTNGTVLQVNDTSARRLSAEGMGALGGGFFSIHITGGTQGYDQTFSDIEADPARSDEYLRAVQEVPSRSGGGSAQWTRQWGDTGLLVGGEARAISGRTIETGYQGGLAMAPTEAGGFARLGSGFVRATTSVNDRTTIVAGFHGDAWHSSSHSSSFSQTVSAFSPRVSVAYRLIGNSVTVRGSVFGGFRPPTLNELYRSFQTGNDVTLPNEALTPETLKSGELGLSVTHGIASARVTGFWSLLDDAVTSVTISTSPALNVRRRENADRIRSMGLEFEGDLRLSPALSVVAAGALMDSRFTGGPTLRDFRVPHVPQYSASATVRYHDPSWTASGQLRVTGSQFDDDVNTRRLDRAAVVDVFGGRTFSRRIMGFAAVENLFDARYDVGRIPVRVEGLPRAVRAGIQVVFP